MTRARAEMLDWQGSGVSVMEVSHRSPEYMAMGAQAEQDLRDLMAIPDNYRVLFLQGGGSLQFAMVPLNLLGSNPRADYINTGYWSGKAIQEGGRFADINIVASGEDQHFTTIPDRDRWRLDPKAAYVHYTPNETIGGLEFPFIPDVGQVPLVADMSSAILSQPIDVSRFGLIYAGAQKNIGPAGITVVIVREDLLGQAADHCPAVMNYQNQADQGSMVNTPPTYSWYLAGLVFQWLKEQGGLAEIAKVNARKSAKLYQAIDNSDFYHCPVDPPYRSRMNVAFQLTNEHLDGEFLRQAAVHNLVNLKGHRAVGGMRASLYNGVREESVDALVAFMADFEQRNG